MGMIVSESEGDPIIMVL